MRRLLGAVAVLAALTGIGPAAASAHPLLLQAAPQPGLVAAQAPESIRLAVSEPVVARGSRVVLTGPGGRPVAVSGLHVDGRTVSVAPARRLHSAVYHVRWSLLGDDGHIVAGSFDFGVAGRNGAAPPGAERLRGAGDAFRGAEDAAADGAVRIIGRWLGILAAALILGLGLLARRLRRPADVEAAQVAWLFVGLAAFEGLLAGAQSGSDSMDFGLLTASPTGKADLARAGVVLVVSVAALRWRARRVRVLAAGSAGVLLTYALSGHALSDPSFFSLLDIGAHVVAASLWLGGVLAVVLVALRGRASARAASRAYAPIAVGALGVAAATGVVAAVREVDGWYFLRFSDYGNVVLAKAALVLLVAALGLWGRRRLEAVGVVAVLALAAVLSGLAQGRGQPLPAERGTLFPGPAFATALLPDGGAQMTVAPARRGRNVVTASPAPEARTPSRVDVSLACACAPGAVRATLARHGGTTWSASVELPADGTWYGYLRVDGKTAAPVQLPVGVPHARGSRPLDVLAVADLSGAAAERCCSHLLGLELAVARINGAGGLDGGRKVAPLVLDSGGDPGRALRLERAARGDATLAFAGGCGDGAETAAADAAAHGVPAIVGDPATAPASGVFRLAADPYAQGLGIAQFFVARGGAGTIGAVRAALGADAASRRFAAGLRAGLAGSRFRVVPTRFAGRAPRDVAALLARTRSAAVVVDGPGQGGADAAAISRAGRAVEGIAPAPILLSERVLSERLIRSAGSLGRIGALQGVSEVSPATKDGILYRRALPLLYRGELASLDGLRGYVTGLALRDAVRDGTNRQAMRAALRRPDVFSDALLAPWSALAPGSGSPSVVAIQPQFLSPTLVPAQIGGEAQDPSYFPDGSWTVTSGRALGVPVSAR